MSFSKLNKLFLIAGAIMALASCKDDETTTKPYLSGSLSFDVEAFVTAGDVIKMTPTGLSHPDDKGIGYYWKVTPDMETNDTTRLESGLSPEGQTSDGSLTYKFKDSLTTYTITCTGFADGYNSSYTSVYVTVVKPGLNGSLTGTEIDEFDEQFRDAGIDYYYVNHAGLEWMRNNLANPAAGVPYLNCEAISSIIGRYYSYEEAMSACPTGWRLPTDEEWRKLAAKVNGTKTVEPYNTIPDIAAAIMGDVKFNSDTMWEYWPKVGDITNKSGLAMIPAGYAVLGESSKGETVGMNFTGIDEYAVFWTADKVENEEGMAYYRYLICDESGMFSGKGDTKTFGASVRCVRENQQ